MNDQVNAKESEVENGWKDERYERKYNLLRYQQVIEKKWPNT